MTETRQLVLIGAAIVAAAIGVSWWRRRGQEAVQEPDDEGDPCEALRAMGAPEEAITACQAIRDTVETRDPCELLRASGYGYAYCKAGEIILEIGDAIVEAIGTNKAENDASNAALNGAILNPDPLGIQAFFDADQDTIYRFQGYNQPLDWTRAIRWPGPPPQHANGCIPMRGVYVSDTVGWQRCVAGTSDYVYHADLHDEAETPTGTAKTVGKLSWTGRYHFGAGNGRDQVPDKRRGNADVLTHPHWYWTDFNAPREENAFPLSVGEGQVPWWVCGRPFVAPVEALPIVTWTGGGSTPRTFGVEWGAAPTRPPPPPAAPPPIDDDSHDIPPGTGPLPGGLPDGYRDGQGYVWRHLPEPHWARLRVGE